MVEVSGITIFHIGEDGHRTPYFPGMLLDAAPKEVLDAIAAHWTPEAVAAWREANQGEPAQPSPSYGAAWADLITSPLYQRALGLAFTALPVNTAMTTFGIAFQAHRDLPHEVWAGALSVAAGHLAMAINATETPLTADEQDWVELWNAAHNLGLMIDWEAL